MRRLADVASRRPWRVIALAVVAFVAAGAYGIGAADRLKPYGVDDPATDSVIANKRVEAATGAQATPGLVAIVRDVNRARIRPATLLLREHPAVARVDRGPLSRDGRTRYLLAYFKPLDDRVLQDVAKALADRLDDIAGVSAGGIVLGNEEANATVERDILRAEAFAFPILMLLSFWFFRSLVAAALPLMVSGLAIVATFFTLRLASEVTDVSLYALNVTTGLGIGLSIDYSLFIISRYREELARLGPGPEALRVTMATAGRTVVFSAATVAAATMALLLFPQRFLYSMGIGATSVTILAAGLSLTVLPAVLVVLGDRVNALAPRRLQRRAAAEARVTTAGFWYRLSRGVMRRPGRIALVTATVLLLAGVPALRAQFTWIDSSTLPADARARQAQETLDREFGANSSQPLTLVVSAPAASHEVREVSAAAKAAEGAAAVSAPVAAGPGLTVVNVLSRAGPLTGSSQQLVADLRRIDSAADVRVTGMAAGYADLRSSLVDHLPAAIAWVAVATLAALFLMTGSVILPLKALLMNALTLSATFGVLVLVFQDGRLEGLLAFESAGGLELTMPVLIFTLAFGLSTDYGVFLLARIKEAPRRRTARRRGDRDGHRAYGPTRHRRGTAVRSRVRLARDLRAGLHQGGRLRHGAVVLIDALVVRVFRVPVATALLAAATGGHRARWRGCTPHRAAEGSTARRIIPPPTVSFEASSTRMNEPVVRLVT